MQRAIERGSGGKHHRTGTDPVIQMGDHAAYCIIFHYKSQTKTTDRQKELFVFLLILYEHQNHKLYHSDSYIAHMFRNFYLLNPLRGRFGIL